MQRFLTFFLAALFTATASAQSKPAPPAASARPDLLLITVDTLRADHVGCYGYANAQTPTLDALCRDGVHFTQAFTASPITNSSHASILTGLYPSRHGVTDFGVPLSADHKTLAESMKAAGYQTAAFIGAVILDSKSLAPGLDRGFDHYENFPADAKATGRWGRVERRAGDVVTRALDWMKAHPKGPRFVWLHVYDPHDPYEPPPPFDKQFAGRPYDGEIAYADQELGRVLAFLKKEGRYSNTLIALLGDHGEGLGEHGENTHGIFLYDSTTHIPLILKYAKPASGGMQSPEQISSVDLMPTLLDLLGVPIPTGLDGKSLSSTLTRTGGDFASSGENDQFAHAVFAETDYPLRFGWAPLKAIRSNHQKYIDAPRPEFYRLSDDRNEVNNLYRPWDEDVQKLRAELADFRKAAPPAPAAAAGKVDPGTIEELKALGYLGNNPGATTVAEPSMLPDPKDKIEVQNLIHSAMMADDSGETAEARRYFQQALEKEPDSFLTLSQLGQIEAKLGDAKRAAQLLARAYALRPDDTTVIQSLGLALEESGDLKAARSALETAVKGMPGQYLARTALGRVCAALGDSAAAQDQLEAAILIDGKKPEARIALARLLLSQGKKDAALRHLRKAEAASPHDPAIKSLLTQAASAGTKN